jgi:hypothetical protein
MAKQPHLGREGTSGPNKGVTEEKIRKVNKDS